jgi:hypothetical protein
MLARMVMRYCKPLHVLNVWSRILRDISMSIERTLKLYQWDDTCTMTATWHVHGLLNVNMLAWLANVKKNSGHVFCRFSNEYCCSWNANCITVVQFRDKCSVKTGDGVHITHRLNDIIAKLIKESSIYLFFFSIDRCSTVSREDTQCCAKNSRT